MCIESELDRNCHDIYSTKTIHTIAIAQKVSRIVLCSIVVQNQRDTLSEKLNSTPFMLYNKI